MARTVQAIRGTRKEREHRMSRWARFRAAIALARTTAKDWCAEQGFTESHLYQCLRGDRESPSTLARVDAFIAKQLGEPLAKSAAPASASTAA